MNFTKKTFPILFLCGFLLSSAYVFVSASEHYAFEAQSPNEKPTSAPTDTSKQKKSFPIKKFTQNTYEELNTKYPMDAPKPTNLKSVVEYDVKSGNYILRTFVGETEIATPFLMTEQEYRNFSAKQDMQNYWKEKNAKSGKNNEDKFSISDMKFNIGAADKVFGPGGVPIKSTRNSHALPTAGNITSKSVISYVSFVANNFPFNQNSAAPDTCLNEITPPSFLNDLYGLKEVRST